MYEFWGKHILCNMVGIFGVNLNDSEFLVKILEKSISAAEATLVQTVCHKFTPEGESIIAILQESHVALHIYPEHHALFLDAFTCGKRSNPEMIIQVFLEELNPEHSSVQSLIRSMP